MIAAKQTRKKNSLSLKTTRLKAERLSMRIDRHAKARLERAAAYHHKSVSDYVVTCALEAAEADIRTHEKIVLAEPAWEAFFNALNNPPPPNARMKAMLKLHDKSVISR